VSGDGGANKGEEGRERRRGRRIDAKARNHEPV
jgi:hypothetical protein